MLQRLHDHHSFCPLKVAGDQIYGAGKPRALIDQVSSGQIQLVALVPDYEKRTDRFVPADFILAKDGLSLTCPGGVTSTKIFTKPGYDGCEFRFTAKMCQGCPFWLTAQQLVAPPGFTAAARW